MTRYFAYGANMDPVHMALQCPGARRLGTARLPEHRFRIAAGGYGTAAPAPGSVVHGVLWDLSTDDETALDAFEGVAAGFYRKDREAVLWGDEQRGSAMLYRAVDSTPGTPAPGYLERIILVAEALGFPRDYLESLSAFLAAG